MGHVREIFDEFERRGAGAAVIMAEGFERMRRFLRDHSYPFPLLSDVRRETTRAYGVYVRLNLESANIIQTDFPADEEIFEVLDRIRN